MPSRSVDMFICLAWSSQKSHLSADLAGRVAWACSSVLSSGKHCSVSCCWSLGSWGGPCRAALVNPTGIDWAVGKLVPLGVAPFFSGSGAPC